mgnify:CR=1 FL=1
MQSIVGVGLIVLGLFVTRSTKAFPGWWALLPVLGAVSCIAAGPNGVLNRYLLSNRLMVWVGLISYPLYLWHWPLLSYARIVQGGEPSLYVRVVLVVAAVLSAASPALLPGVAAPLPVLPLLVLPLPVLPLAGVAGSAPGLLPSSSRPFAGRPSISGPNGDGVDAASGTRNGR